MAREGFPGEPTVRNTNLFHFSTSLFFSFLFLFSQKTNAQWPQAIGHLFCRKRNPKTPDGTSIRRLWVEEREKRGYERTAGNQRCSLYNLSLPILFEQFMNKEETVFEFSASFLRGCPAPPAAPPSVPPGRPTSSGGRPRSGRPPAPAPYRQWPRHIFPQTPPPYGQSA